MPVDVLTEAVIARPRAEVAAYAMDPDNVTAWYANIEAVEWRTPPPLAQGSRVAFVAHFLARRITYTYEVTVLIPGEQLVMQTAEGPFPMQTAYTFGDGPEPGTTRMILRNRGEPAGFGRLAAPMVAAAMRRANRKDLQRLRALLEAPAR
jgi:hypothetical protein